MIEVEIWLDLTLDRGRGLEQALTLFARHELPSVPRPGEAVSYMQAKGSTHLFNIVDSLGVMPQHVLSTSVEEVRHYASGESEPPRYNTSVRLEPVTVASIEDAEAIVEFLTLQLSFEVDPYGQNMLVSGNTRGA